MTKYDGGIFRDFNINNFPDKFKTIKNEIFLQNNLNIDTDEKAIKFFLIIIKNFGKRMIYNLKYISKENLNFVFNSNLSKKLVIQNISLIFIFLYIENKINEIGIEDDTIMYERKYINIYKQLFNIIDNFFFSTNNGNDKNNKFIFDISDIFDIIRLNLLLGLHDLSNKSFIFNETIKYLGKIYFSNENNKDIKLFLSSILSLIFKNLLNSEKNLHFLKRDQNLNSLSMLKITNFLFSCQNDSKIHDCILDILGLIYEKNYSSLISDYILDMIKNCFYEVKKDNLEKIIFCIRNIYGLVTFLNNLFLKEEKENYDPYEPSSYFVFKGSEYSGINYNPSNELLRKNFTLIFCFKVEEIKENIIYPIISFVTHGNKNEIIFNISIENGKLKIYQEGGTNMKEVENIKLNNFYLIVVEYKTSIIKDKIKLYINNKKFEITSGNINDKAICSLQIGYLSHNKNSKNNHLFENVRNFKGIIGPIIQFSNIFDDKNFIHNIFKLKGKYDLILLADKNINLDNYHDYEEYQKDSDSQINEALNYFIGISKKINEDFQYSICPLSIINNINQDTYYYCQDIYNKSIKKPGAQIFPDFNTLSFPSSKSFATYAKKKQKSLSSFLEYDGISIYTLIVEYFYNILRMLIKISKDEKIELVNEIINILRLIIKSVFQIFRTYRLDPFFDSMDTFGFSLKKLLGLIIDIQPLNEPLIYDIIKPGKLLIKYSLELPKQKESKNYILNYLSKLVTLIFSPKYINISDYSCFKELFEFIIILMEDNPDLLNENFLKKFMSFSPLLDYNSFCLFMNKMGKNIQSDNGYKTMKKAYKNMIIYFIGNTNNLKLYFYYLHYIFDNESSSWTEKYELVKIYYKFQNIQLLYDNKKDKDSNISFNDLINIFKKDKNNKKNIFTEKELLKEYKNYLKILIEKPTPKDEKSENSLELIKAIFIMLIYEHNFLFELNSVNLDNDSLSNKIKGTEVKKMSLKNDEINMKQITFFKVNTIREIKNKHSLSSKHIELNTSNYDENEINNERTVSDYSIEEKDDSSQSSEFQDNKHINGSKKEKDNNDNFLFNSFLNTKKYSFYTIKGFFLCLCDKLEKGKKIKFLKNKGNYYEPFKNYITKFDRYEKELFFEILNFIELIDNENIIEKSFELIFSFINDCIVRFINDNSDKINNNLFLHLFESKSIFNCFFDFCLNNKVLTKTESKNKIIDSIKNINNNILVRHPKSYIFSFIKRLVQKEDSKTFLIIDDICKSIIRNLKLSASKINKILFQNLICFINILMKVSGKYSNNFSKLLLKDNFSLFFSLQNFINELSKLEIIIDPNLYVTNPSLFYQIKDIKKDSKIFQSSKTKLLNNQIIFLNIFELALNMVYLIWKSQDEDENIINTCFDYISKIHKEMLFNEEYIGYYLDLSNPFFKLNNKNLNKIVPEKINKLVNNEANNPKNKNATFVRENRIITFSLFLIIMKYQSCLINFSQTKKDNLNENLIRQTFTPLIDLSIKEIESLIPNISKIKDNKNFENMIERKESKSKDFKNYNKNYYKYFIEKLKILNFDIKTLKGEIENKFISDAYQQYRISINLLKKEINEINEKNEKQLNYTAQVPSKHKKHKIEEKKRKDSYGDYNNEKELTKARTMINEIKFGVKNEKKIIIKNSKKNISLDFEEVKYPILCTKRDLIMKKFGYFYYKYYFRNDTFIKLKKLFLYQNNPNNINNNYYGFEKSMKNKYPFYTKNFSNNHLYYPKLFSRPYSKFFEDKYFDIAHGYFNKEKYDKNNKEKIMHLEYGHGLLNQPNFDLYDSSYKNEMKNNWREGNFRNESEEDLNIFNIRDFFENLEKKKQSFSDNDLTRTSTFNKSSDKITESILKKNMNSFIKPENNTLKIECEKISYRCSSNGYLKLGNNFLIFQTNKKFEKEKYNDNPDYLLGGSSFDLNQKKKQIIIPYSSIAQILNRKFLFHDIAVEIFLHNGKSYYFNFYKINTRSEFIKTISKKISEDKIIKNSIEYFENKKYTNKWLEGKLSTLDYLLLINKFSDRSYNTLSQYLIFPWLLSNFEDIYNDDNIRNFKLPISYNSRDELETNILENDWDRYQYHFSSYLSNYMYTNHYLIRMYPYIDNQIKLQDERFDSPARQFNTLNSVMSVFKEFPNQNFELVPEFYFLPEFFMNLNYCDYGKFNSNGELILVNNLGIGPCFHQILEVINYHQLMCNSEIIASHINFWIDNIFGENQISSKKNSINLFPKECYAKYIKEIIDEEFKKIKSMNKNMNNPKNVQKTQKTSSEDIGENNIISQIESTKSELKQALSKCDFLGHCPTQLFTKSHPTFSKKIEPVIYSYSNKNNLQIILSNAKLITGKKDILYMQESSNEQYFYIVCEHEILVYNKHLKLKNSLSINHINNIPKNFSGKYNANKNYFKSLCNYKYLIFDIYDCKYFFIGGYLDNSLRIYFKNKEKEKNMEYLIYVEDQISCIRNSLENKFFFTGHRNGKIIKWNLQINKEINKIDIKKENSIRGHKSSVKMIELIEKYECFISVDNDELLFIRKIYDFELLSYIKFNKYKKKIIDINICNQIIILTIFKIKTNEIFIYTYSLNGLKLGKISSKLKLPISSIPNTDEIILFGLANIYFTKVAFNEKTSLLAITNNLDFSNINAGLISEEDNLIVNNFNNDLIQLNAVAYFYDSKNRVLFCLFEDGILYRMNFVKNA